MTGTSKVEPVIISGGGAIGVCIALSLAMRGVGALLIDRMAPWQGTSYGNAGVISPWYVVPQSLPGLWRKIPGWLLRPDGPLFIKPSYLPQLAPWGWKFLRQGTRERVAQISDVIAMLNRDSIALYRKNLADTGYGHLVRDSCYVHLFRDAKRADIDGFPYCLLRAKGAVMEKLTGAQLRQLEPSLRDGIEAAILIKGQARTTNPGEIGRILFEKFIGLGGRFAQADMEAITPDARAGWRLQTKQGVMYGRQIVIAAGAWSGRLLAPLGVRVPLEAERGYHVEFPDPRVTLNHSVKDAYLQCVASSMDTGLRLAGTAEFAGLDAPPNPKRIDMLKRCARRMLPGLNMEDAKSWMGVRPATPDSLPYIGEVPGHAGLFVAFGHGHSGLMMAPKTGEIMADLLQQRPVNVDYRALRLDRFRSID